MKIILFISAIILCTNIFANKSPDYTQQNVIELNSTFTLQQRIFDTYGGMDKRTSIRVLPKIGYFIYNNIQIGTIFSYEYSRFDKPGWQILDRHSINPSLHVSYYFNINDVVFPFAGIGYGYTLNKVIFEKNTDQADSWGYLILTGLKYKVLSNVLISFEILYEWNKNIHHSTSTIRDGFGIIHSTIGEQLNIFIGLGIYL